MQKLYVSTLTLRTILGLSAQEVIWQKDIQSSTQDFLSQITTTIDQQHLISGSSIQGGSQKIKNRSLNVRPVQLETPKQNNGYDFHLIKLNQQGEQVWEKYFSGNNHDFLSATVSTQEGGFFLAGTSYSKKGLDMLLQKDGCIRKWIYLQVH